MLLRRLAASRLSDAGFGEADVSAAFVQDKPAIGDRIVKAGLVFSRCALRLEQKPSVDLLDTDVAVLRRR